MAILDSDYSITTIYSVPDDAWYVELELTGLGRTLATAIVPDEDPAREPTVCFDSPGPHADIPYRVMRRFMDHVDSEIRTSRYWMRLRPEIVEVVHGLRQEYLGAISDEEFREVLEELRATVPAADLPSVLAASFGRRLDGSTTDDVLSLMPADEQETAS